MKIEEIVPLNELSFRGLFKSGKKTGSSARIKNRRRNTSKSKPSRTMAGTKFVVSNASKLAAKTMIGALKGNGLILKSVVGTPFLIELYSKYKELETQYRKYSTGDRTTEIFNNLPENEAKQKFTNTKSELIGEALLVIGPMLTKTDVVWKFLGGGAGKFGGAIGAAGGAYAGMSFGIGGAFAGAALGGKLLGSIGGAPFTIAALLSKLISGGISGPLFILFVQSSAGQKFLHEVMKDSLTTLLGATGQFVFQLSDVAVGWFKTFFTDNKDAIAKNINTAGTTATTQPATTQPTNQTGQSVQASTPTAATTLSPEKQALVDYYKGTRYDVKFDKNNPNIMRLAGNPVTNAAGKIIIDRGTKQDYMKYYNGPNPFSVFPGQ